MTARLRTFPDGRVHTPLRLHNYVGLSGAGSEEAASRIAKYGTSAPVPLLAGKKSLYQELEAENRHWNTRGRPFWCPGTHQFTLWQFCGKTTYPYDAWPPPLTGCG